MAEAALRSRQSLHVVSGDPAVSARDVVVRHGSIAALRGVTVAADRGEIVAVMGRNGAGKSTLLSTFVGLHTPVSGIATVGGSVASALRGRDLVSRVGLVPQEPTDVLVSDHVGDECAAADRDCGAEPGTARALLDRLAPGVADATHPRDLSEGQRLALALAVVLAAHPPVLLLDEPTRGLDYPAKQRLVATLRELAAAGHCVILATHDVELAAEVATRVVVLAEGEVVADGPATEVVVGSPMFAPQVSKVLVAPALAHRRRGRCCARGRVVTTTALPPGRDEHVRAAQRRPTGGGADRAPFPRRDGPRERASALVAFAWPLMAPAGSSIVAHASDAPWLFAALLPARARRRPRRGGRRRPRREGHRPARRPLGRRAPRCGRSAAGTPASSRCGSCSSSADGRSGPASASAWARSACSPPRWSPAASARGCRSRWSARPGSGSGPGCFPGRPGAASSGCSRRTPSSPAIAYGFLLNLWFWPFITAEQGFPAGLSYVPGAAFVENLQHWLLFNLTTSLGFDLPRAVLAVVLVVVAGRPVLTALRRASRRAAFEVPVRFEEAR